MRQLLRLTMLTITILFGFTQAFTDRHRQMKDYLYAALTGIACAFCITSTAAVSQDMQIAQSSRLFGGDPSSSMQIDINPDSEVNTINTTSGRQIPIAILGSPTLDVISINPRTIRLEGVGVMLVGKSDKSLCKQADINADGHIDLICGVRTTGFRVNPGSYTIRLRAETYDKRLLRGEDQLQIIRQ